MRLSASPPYPNEKDYTRTTRLESVLLGFVTTRRAGHEEGLVRSNTRGVYRGDTDDEWITMHPEIARIASAIEARRIEMGKTSGFERMYPRVTRLYFGEAAATPRERSARLRPAARLAYVVGDQASYLRVMIRTGEPTRENRGRTRLRAGRDRSLFRAAAQQRHAELREEVVLLRWPADEERWRDATN